MERRKLQIVFPPVRFYRIIDHSVLHHHKLSLPDDFVQKYGGELLNVVRVKVPVGGIWLIGVEERADKTLWLDEGWQNFMDYYSVGFGHFLLFNYKGNSKFDVNIFDLTATEIEYAFAANNYSTSPNHTTTTTSDNADSVEPFPQQIPKLTYLELNALHENTDEDQLHGGNYTTASPTNPQTEVSPNPSFKVTMKPYHVETAFILSLPAEFVKKNMMSSKEINYVELQDPKGRKWPIRCLKRSDRPAYLSGGWHAFVQANKLVRGDVCVFELIQGKGIMLKVSIFPAKN